MQETAPLNPLGWRQRYPWLNLFRAFQIAIGPRKLSLGFLAALALLLGNWLIDQLPFAPEPAVSWAERASWAQIAPTRPPSIGQVEGVARDPIYALLKLADRESILAWPLLMVVRPLELLFQTGQSWSQIAYVWTWLLWVLMVWAVFGGALTRMVAVQFARDQSVGIRRALRFSLRKFLSYLAAPLMPMVAIGFFWVLGCLIGLLGRIPAIGSLVYGSLFGLLVLFGFGMAVILLVLAVGWPLMTAAISIEDGDGFDGLNRTYSYVCDRPWHLLWYVLVAVVYGSALLFFVMLLGSLSVHLAVWCSATGLGDTDSVQFLLNAAENMSFDAAARGNPLHAGGLLIVGWVEVVSLLMTAFGLSYFWTAATIIYFLLRQSDDGVVLDQVTIPEEQPPRVPLPVVGIPGTELAHAANPPSVPTEEPSA